MVPLSAKAKDNKWSSSHVSYSNGTFIFSQNPKEKEKLSKVKLDISMALFSMRRFGFFFDIEEIDADGFRISELTRAEDQQIR